MDEEILSLLLDVCKGISDKVRKIEDLFEGSCDFLDKEISDLWMAIGDYIGLPEDSAFTDFSRDEFYKLLNDFGYGEISKEKTIKKLLEMKNDSEKGLFI